MDTNRARFQIGKLLRRGDLRRMDRAFLESLRKRLEITGVVISKPTEQRLNRLVQEFRD